MNALLPLTVSAWVFMMTAIVSKLRPVDQAREAVQRRYAGAPKTTNLLSTYCDYGGICRASVRFWDMAPVAQTCWKHEAAARRDHPRAERREGLS